MYLERVSLLMRHEDVAQVITDYDINNAYQYIIAREETHLSWLQHGLLDLGATLVGDPHADRCCPPRAMRGSRLPPMTRAPTASSSTNGGRRSRR